MDVVDLRRQDLLFPMLLDPWSWRERCVERLTLGHAHHVEVSNRYQVHIQEEQLPIETPAMELSPVRVLLPLSTRPKKPLLNFALHGPGGRDVNLLTRREVAKLQRGLIAYMLERSPLRDEMADCWPPELLEAMFAFTPDVFLHREAQVGWLEHLLRNPAESAYRDYLSTDGGIELSQSQLTQCLALQDQVANQLSEVLGEERDPHSSTEQPLLALPNLEAHGPPLTGSEVVELLERYAQGVALARDDGQESVLAVLAEYGRRWQVIVDTVVRLDQRETVGTSEHVPFGSTASRWPSLLRLTGRERISHRIELLDAPSVHCEVRTADHRVELTEDYDVRSPEGFALGLPFWDSVRYTPEFLSLYTSGSHDLSWATLTVPFRPLAHIRWPARFILMLTLVAVIMAGIVDFDDSAKLLTALSLLTFPTTFAVTLLLLREGSGLSARLQLPLRIALTVLTSALWLVTVGRLFALTDVV